MTKENETIKKIQELVPSIMELKFGCKVVDEEYGRKHIYYFGSENKDFVYLHKDSKERQEWKNKFKDNFKILGRPISLEDILIALEKKGIPMRIDTEGEFLKYKKTDDDIGYNWIETDIFWQLNKPFHEQSQNTKDFIGDLIK